MGAFLTSLASIGSQYGEAKDEKQKEDFARAEKIKQINAQDAYLQLAQQAEKRQSDEFEQRKKAGDLIEMKDGRIWSVSQGRFIDSNRPDPMVTLKTFIKSQPPEIQKQLEERAQAEVELNPNDPKNAIQEVMRYADAQQAEANRKADAATRHTEHEQDVTESEKFRKQQSKDQRDFMRTMVDYRLQEKAKQMTPQERKVYDSINQMTPMVDRTIKFMEDHKLQDENDLVFGDRSALMQHLRQRGYAFGQKQEPVTQQLIKDAAALQIMGAAPWQALGRGKYMYETIKQHLPSPTDTPANLYDKLTWLRDNVLMDAKQSLSGYEIPGGSGQGGDAPPAGAVIHDFSQSH